MRYTDDMTAANAPAKSHDLSAWLTTSQAARIVGLGEVRMRQLAEQGRVEFITTAHGRLFNPADVERLRAERERS